jgi:3-hydroxyisobutyrate dehydrogenase-like beta-hydroxyacid dehydrogenase
MLKSENKSRSTFVSTGPSGSVADERAVSTVPGERNPLQGHIGFVGLGHMGAAMAANLAAAGHQVTAHVRRAGQMNELTALGLKPTTDIADLYNCEFVISMLPDDAAVREVVFGRPDLGVDGLAKQLVPGAIHLSMSTISTAASSELASEHARYGQGYVAAPVFGNPDAAKARQLFVIAGGAPADVARCRAIFDALGQQTFLVSGAPATANLIKLAGNAMSAATLEIIGEVLALARKRGLDPHEVLAILTGTMFGSRVHRIYGSKIAGQQYTAGGFVFPLALKDIRLALNEAESAGVPMPSVSVVRDRLITGIARGYSELDWSALGLLAAEEAGLTSEPTAAAARLLAIQAVKHEKP